MGAYLSEPITKKESSVEENEEIRVASSSMQGWRVSQEDAHNAIINFDERTSFFAVYDGHGGHEVAEYTAKKLPSFIKRNEDYQKGNIQKALVDCFIEFDRTIVNRDVVAELKRIAGTPDDDVEDEQEMDNLYEEATMPLEDVIAKYEARENVDGEEQNDESPSDVDNTDEVEKKLSDNATSNPILLKNPTVAALAGSSESKPISPYLRAKANTKVKNEGDDTCTTAKEIDFKKEQETQIEINGTDTKEEVSKEPSKVDCATTGIKRETNGKHKIPNISVQDMPVNNEIAQGKDEVTTRDSDNKNNEVEAEAKLSNGEVDIKANNQAKGPSDTNGHHAEKNVVNGESGGGSAISKGKGKGKGKGKSNIIPNKTPNETGDCEAETQVQSRVKRASRSAAELYRNILGNDNENEDDEVLDEEDDSDEDVVYGQDDSESDDDEEEGDGAEEEDDPEDSEDDEDGDEEHDNGEGFIGGEFNEEPGNDSGCTSVVALVRGNELYVANAGDSRCVVCRDGKAIEMSFDHKPEDTPERDRIENAGGRVTPDGRVNGGLNLSRAIGDHAYKTNKNLPLQEQMISPVPDIRTLQLDPTKDSYIILACDGIWNSLTSQEVVEFISERLDNFYPNKKETQDPTTQELQTICEELFEHCLAPDTMNDGTGMDNMTAVIVKLRPTFDGNKSAKSKMIETCSSLSKGCSSSSGMLSTSIKNSSMATDSSTDKKILDSENKSSNGETQKLDNLKRTLETASKESLPTETPCSKKAKLEDENSIDAKSNQSSSVKT